MPHQRRKLAFSGKKKKDQLLQKRQQKGSQKYLKTSQESYEDSDTPEVSRKLMEQPFPRGGHSGSGAGRNKNLNRYNMQFYQESKKDLELIKQEGFKTLETITAKQREIDGKYFENFDFPTRPEWVRGSTKQTLDRNENQYFREYVDKLQKRQRTDNKELSLFELNLETWRQLWRVLEFSDILLIIVDVRYATLMFPPSLYDYILNTMKKHAIVVFNKVDLVAPDVVVAWRHYFNENYPNLPVVLFASFSPKTGKNLPRVRKGYKRSMDGVFNIYRECQKIVQSDIDLSTWEEKILEDMRVENVCIEEDSGVLVETNLSKINSDADEDASPHSHVKYRDGILTVGCIGFPNVGKSTLINALKGRKVVSVSRTPGHTKHFQTIFLTNVVRLCDSPGLVFPSSTPKHIQVLLGSYPISQVQVPYRPLKFLAEQLNLPQLLKIHLPDDFDEWSAVAIADAWALKRGFLTAKAARSDRYRAANHLLRLCLAGQQQMILQFYPPGYDEMKEKWENHAEVDEVKKYQNAEVENNDTNEDTSSVCSETADSEDITSSSSNDETNADDDEAAACASSAQPQPKSRNAFALLEDE